MSDSKNESTSRDDWLVHYLELPRYKAIFVLSIGLFLCGFLLIFQPFGVSNYDPQFKIDLDFLSYMLGVGARSRRLWRPANSSCARCCYQ